MRGDQADFVSRLRLTMPEGWAADQAPLLDGVLNGFGAAWACLAELLRQVRLQARLRTVAGPLLDLACSDFFGGSVARRLGEDDEGLRGRFAKALGRERGTRQGLVTAAAEVGYDITVFEPARATDTGAYGVAAGLAWGAAGGWGSLSMPGECFVTLHAVNPVDDVNRAIVETLPAGGAAWVKAGA